MGTGMEIEMVTEMVIEMDRKSNIIKKEIQSEARHRQKLKWDKKQIIKKLTIQKRTYNQNRFKKQIIEI